MGLEALVISGSCPFASACYFDRFLVISSVSVSFRPFPCHFDRFLVISTEGRNPDHSHQDFSVDSLLRNDNNTLVISTVPLSFRAQREILATVIKISQSLRSFEMTNHCHFDRFLVISTEGRNLNHSHQDFSVDSLLRNDKLMSFRPFPCHFDRREKS